MCCYYYYYHYYYCYYYSPNPRYSDAARKVVTVLLPKSCHAARLVRRVATTLAGPASLCARVVAAPTPMCTRAYAYTIGAICYVHICAQFVSSRIVAMKI